MSELESLKGRQFLTDLSQAYGLGLTYIPQEYLSRGGIEDHPSFVGIRKQEIGSFLSSRFDGKADQSRAFLSEWLAFIALQNNLHHTPYNAFLAPPQLETGIEGLSGIDMVLCERTPDNATNPLLGINIKLESIRNKRNYEKHRYDPRIQAPFCHVSLGDWQIPTREYEAIGIRPWINEYVAPNILKTGKIPYFLEFQEYIIQTLVQTLGHYRGKVDDIRSQQYEPHPQEMLVVPPTPSEFDLFYNKLCTVDTLFNELLNSPVASM